MVRSAALIAVGVLCVTACGDTATESTVESIPGAGADATSESTVPAPTSATTGDVEDATGDANGDECPTDLRTFEVAIEAYSAQYGRSPDLEADLVEAGLLRAEFDTYDFVDGKIARVNGVPCENEPTGGDDPSSLPTADEWLDLFTPEQIAGLGGRECARELAVIAAAVQRFLAREGREPDTLAELDGDIETPLELWRWANDDLVPVEGSGCIDPDGTDDTSCRVEARTLQVAREAYLAQYGPGTEPTEDDLVAAEFLRAPSDSVDLIDGVATATPGGPCEGVDLDPAPAPSSSDGAQRCITDYRTLQVAIEAFVIQEGREPDNEGQMVDAAILARSFDSYDVVYGEIVPGDGSSCEAPPN